MSYDVYLTIDTGGDRPAIVTEICSPTYNLAPMLRAALGTDMRDHGEGSLDGMLASDALRIVKRALESMALDPERFKALNPPNGWGTYEDCVEFLQWLHDACTDNPKATVRT